MSALNQFTTPAVAVGNERQGANPDPSPIEKQRVRAEALTLSSANGMPYKRPRRWLRAIGRLLGLLVTSAVVVALGAAFFTWTSYRMAHVVSRTAYVQGHIADLGTRLDGVVIDIPVEAGESVAAGQVVAVMRSDSLRARVESAQAREEGSVHELEAARGREQEARAELARFEQLGFSAAISGEQVDIAKSALRVAVAMVARAKSNIAEHAADLRVAQADLSETVIHSPDDGAVVRRIVQPGGSVLAGQPIISLWLGGVWVEAWIDESDIGAVRIGHPATVTVKSEGGREYRGTIQSIGVSTDFELPDTVVPQPRNQRMLRSPVVAVRIQLDDPSPLLFPGMSAVVSIEKPIPDAVTPESLAGNTSAVILPLARHDSATGSDGR